MKCPACGLYHPAFYERCVACGIFLDGSGQDKEKQISQDTTDDLSHVDPRTSLARIRFRGVREQEEAVAADNIARVSAVFEKIKTVSSQRGFFLALLIVVVFAGATAFFLMRSPDDERLLNQGKQQLSLGQYAFAVQTLSKVSALKPNDPHVFLALARAYIGVDQVNEAWDCITHAQQLGVGVVADPALATELANYYKQHGQYEKAIDLLRPLATASVPGKRAELADLDALKGDDCLEQGKFDDARRAWEEVQQLNEGARATEAKSRLATIYLKLVDIAYSHQEDVKALDYLNKVNALEENTRNYLLAADICEHDGKLAEAIDQMQKALKLKADDQILKSRLAQLFMARGKELILGGDSSGGSSYLQQANALDANIGYPSVYLKDLNVGIVGGKGKIAGDLWNPGNTSINSLTIKVQLYNNADGQTLWQKEQRIIDEFVAPLAAQQTKSFAFFASIPSHGQEELAFKVYLDGSRYGSYPLKAGSRLPMMRQEAKLPGETEPWTHTKFEKKTGSESLAGKESQFNDGAREEHLSIGSKRSNEAETAAKSYKSTSGESESKESGSPEEKTMKDLEF